MTSMRPRLKELNDNPYIVYDTDIKVGDYRIVPEDDINALYKVGIKKK